MLFGSNKINIADYAPKPVVVIDSKQKKQGRFKRNTTDFFDKLGPEEGYGGYQGAEEFEEPT